MSIKNLICVAALSCGLVSSGFAVAASLGLGSGVSLGDALPSQCSASGNYECYKFVNDTASGSTPVAAGVTIQMTLSGTGACNAYTWTLPSTPKASAVGYLWSNPASGGCVVSSVTFSVPSNAAITPVPVTVVSQGTAGSQDETDMVVTLTGTAAAPVLNVGQYVYAVHR